jgi:hypothetical protein
MTDLNPVDAMTNDYRAMCAELVDSLHKHTSMWEGHEIDLVTRARALLAQPVAEEHQDKLDRLIALDRDEPDRWATNAQ